MILSINTYNTSNDLVSQYNNLITQMQLINLDNTSHLISSLVVWIDTVVHRHKRFFIDRLKLRFVNSKVKHMTKAKFESISSSSNESSTLMSYVSISDFKPMVNNYSSVKILDYESYGVSSDLKNNISKKIEYSSNQIFNKETFLEQWMTQETLDVVTPESYPKADYSNKKITSYHEEALESIRKYSFGEYCKVNVKKKSGLFGLGENEAMKHRKSAMSSSLTYLKEMDVQVAVDAFEYLLKSAGQIQSEGCSLYWLSKLVKLVYQDKEDLKEEVYLQVIKQLSSKKIIYLKIFCMLSASIRPTVRIYIPLLNYLYEEYHDFQNAPHKHLYNYAFYHLIKNFEQPRTFYPSVFELFCFFNARKIPIIVSFPKEKVFYIESYTGVEELLTEIIQYYNLDPNISYLLEINSYLLEKGVLLDEFNRYAQLEEDQYQWKDYISFKGFKALIVLKNVTDLLKSPRTHTIMYNYCIHQYLRGLYSLKSAEIVKIAALKIHSEIDNQTNYNFAIENLVSKRKLRTLNLEERDKFKKHIIKQYFSIKDKSKYETRKEILSILEKSKGFNTHFFKCQIFIEDFQEFTAWVGLQKDRFLIIEPSTGRIMRNILYNKIKEWGTSKSEICLKVHQLGEFHIDTCQIQVLSSIFQNYLQHHTQLLAN